MARANLAIALHALDRVPEAGQLHEEALADFGQMLGGEHPYTASVRDGRLIPRDLEPPLV
ncbi:MAG: tetratricopeptide repeat protein [Streptomyces sp.]|nr:tetratricopeptide repeat protein [Streptomyces sp.]